MDLDRAQIGEEVEPLAQRADTGRAAPVAGHGVIFRPALGAEQDGVRRPGVGAHLVGYSRAVAKLDFVADRGLGDLDVEIAPFSDPLDHAPRLARHFGSDAVAGQDHQLRNIGRHAFPLLPSDYPEEAIACAAAAS